MPYGRLKYAAPHLRPRVLQWSGAIADGATPATVLDVGCGIGGTSRYIAAKLPGTSVTGGWLLQMPSAGAVNGS